MGRLRIQHRDASGDLARSRPRGSLRAGFHGSDVDRDGANQEWRSRDSSHDLALAWSPTADSGGIRRTIAIPKTPRHTDYSDGSCSSVKSLRDDNLLFA